MSTFIDESENLSLRSIPSTKKSRKSSPVHEHCRTPTPEEREEKPESKWIWCKHCPHVAQSTTNIRNHLRVAHEIVVPTAISAVRTIAAETVESLYTKLLLQLGDKDSLDQEILRRTVSQSVVSHTLLDLVVVRRLPFSCVGWPEFHAFIQALNPHGSTFIPTSHNTLKKHVTAWYIQAKDIVRKRLQSSQTSIHLAIDIWTSPSNDLLLGVCASFVDAQGSFRNILIALRIVRGHSGQNQWNALLPVLQEYGIDDKIGTVMGDNSTTNDTLCRTIADYLTSVKKVNWIQTHSRLRCMGHILNLIVQAFLFLSVDDEEEIGSYDEEATADEELEERRQKERATSIRTKMGVMGKVHNIVIHIRASPQRTSEFIEAAGKTIPLDNRTRWNSWFRMLQTTLEPPILNAVRDYTERYITQGTLDRRDELSNSDIALLRTIASFLGVFDSASLFLQGQQSTIERVLEAVEIIKEHLELSLVRRTIRYLVTILTKVEK